MSSLNSTMQMVAVLAVPVAGSTSIQPGICSNLPASGGCCVQNLDNNPNNNPNLIKCGVGASDDPVCDSMTPTDIEATLKCGPVSLADIRNLDIKADLSGADSPDSTFWEFMNSLTGVTVLDLDDCQLTSVPSIPPTVTNFFLRRNSLTYIDGDSTELLNLNLEGNDIRTFDITGFPKLISFSLQDNNLDVCDIEESLSDAVDTNYPDPNYFGYLTAINVCGNDNAPTACRYDPDQPGSGWHVNLLPAISEACSAVEEPPADENPGKCLTDAGQWVDTFDGHNADKCLHCPTGYAAGGCTKVREGYCVEGSGYCIYDVTKQIYNEWESCIDDNIDCCAELDEDGKCIGRIG